MKTETKPAVSILWAQVRLGNDENRCDVLKELDVSHECKVVSAHAADRIAFGICKNRRIERYRGYHRGGAGGGGHRRECARRNVAFGSRAVPGKAKLIGKDSLLSMVQDAPELRSEL